jgi:hypothetical protein
MNLDKNSRAYKLLVQMKALHSNVITNPITRFIIASYIYTAYIRYTEKRADLFATEHGYVKGGISFATRLERHLSKRTQQTDPYHPYPHERRAYLEKAAQKYKQNKEPKK